MDAREAQKWLEQKLKERAMLAAEDTLQGRLDRAPMSELEYRKIDALKQCRCGSNTDAKHFIQAMFAKGYGALITRNQSEYIDILFHRYRRQHGGRVIFPFTEIMRFNKNLEIESYECNPENDAYTIQFHVSDETTFF